MSQHILIDRMFDALIDGDRDGARAILAEVQRQDTPADRIITDLFWPVYERIETLHRNDQISTLARHLATRLLRVLADQTAARLSRTQPNGSTIFAVSGPTDPDELAAQMAVDLLEAHGYTVTFAGAGVATDEILARIQDTHPDHLLIFASAPRDLPEIRRLIDTLGEINAHTQPAERPQIVVGAGVFRRAEGLAAEIGADLWADSPAALLQEIAARPHQRARPTQRTVGRNRPATAKSNAA